MNTTLLKVNSWYGISWQGELTDGIDLLFSKQPLKTSSLPANSDVSLCYVVSLLRGRQIFFFLIRKLNIFPFSNEHVNLWKWLMLLVFHWDFIIFSCVSMDIFHYPMFCFKLVNVSLWFREMEGYNLQIAVHELTNLYVDAAEGREHVVCMWWVQSRLLSCEREKKRSKG